MTESTLSDKIFDDHFNRLLKTSDVKEFIKRLKAQIPYKFEDNLLHEAIDILAGSKLVDNSSSDVNDAVIGGEHPEDKPEELASELASGTCICEHGYTYKICNGLRGKKFEVRK